MTQPLPVLSNVASLCTDRLAGDSLQEGRVQVGGEGLLGKSRISFCVFLCISAPILDTLVEIKV